MNSRDPTDQLALPAALPLQPAAQRPWLERLLGIQPPDVSPRGWHVSPVVDVLAYHFSWVFMLVPLLFLGNTHPADYRFLFLLAIAGNFAHQALSLPLVYLDGEVFERESRRATAVPLTLLILFVVSVVWWRLDTPIFTTFKMFLGPVAVVAYAWNFWHVYMQKYGILRLHDAKAVREGSRPVPGLVDRLLVFGGLPLAIAVIGPRYREFLLTTYSYMDGPLRAILDPIEALGSVPVILGALAAAASILWFLVHEHREHGLRNVPRLSAALGMTLLSASLLVFNPIKVVIAFGFSHVVEYVVFAWAYQRRRHAVPRPESPLLGRLMRRPALAMSAFVLVVGTAFFMVEGWTFYVRPGTKMPVILGTPLVVVTALLAIFLSMAHFWFDGFLWKMRRPDVRGSI